jgi:peptidyl-Asp metalloendopeptidase
VQDNYAAPIDPTPSTSSTLYGLRDFEVQYWTGSAWLPVPGGTVAGNALVWRQFTFSPITTSRIRVYVTNAQSAYSRITEIEAWGF